MTEEEDTKKSINSRSYDDKISCYSKLILQASSFYDAWYYCPAIYNFEYYCSETINLIVSLREVDKAILKYAIFELGIKPSNNEFSEFEPIAITTDFTPQKPFKGIKLLDNFLKKAERVKKGNNFVNNYMNYLRKSDSAPKNKNDIIDYLEWIDGMMALTKEIYFALLDHIPKDNPLKALSEMLYSLESARKELFEESIIVGPYILNAGSLWGKYLKTKTGNSCLGQLKISYEHVYKLYYRYIVNCQFSYVVNTKVKNISWTIREDNYAFPYKENLLKTWDLKSGVSFIWPEKNKCAYIIKDHLVSFELESYFTESLEKHEKYQDILKAYRSLINEVDGRGIVEFGYLNRIGIFIQKIQEVIRLYKNTDANNNLPQATNGKKQNYRLNATQELIISTLGKDQLIADDIAKKAGVQNNSNFRTALSVLHQIGVIKNEYLKGYRLEENFYYLLEQIMS